MKLVVVAHEFPFPANHGAKVDIWNRILALEASGMEVFLVTWYNTDSNLPPSESAIEEVKAHVSDLAVFPLSSKSNRLKHLWKYPMHVSARLLSEFDYDLLLSRLTSFGPEVVFIDHIYPGATGQRIAKDLAVPVGLRLHNIEHEYMLGQYKLAKTWKSKTSILLSLVNLKKFEYSIISSVKAAFDISATDMEFWKSQKVGNMHWLPPVFPKRISPTPASSQQYDIGFLGNLNTPNNVEGLKWFFQSVLPKIKAVRPQTSILIMGSNPSNEVRDFCSSQELTTLIPNPPDPSMYLSESKVLINPVRFGSGVNIKSIDMLFLPNPVVSTSAGIKGLPDMFRDVFHIADNADNFSEAILEVLAKPYVLVSDPKRETLRKSFLYESVNIIADKLKSAKYVA
jgi:hypothetical protein